jgi:hypothetical protein
MAAGDTAYVGPGLYRETILVQQSGTPEARIAFVADPTGTHTGDPPGPVVVTGAEPVDAGRFTAAGMPGVFRAAFAEYPVLGVAEMDGPQPPYLKAGSAMEHVRDGLSELEVVARRPSSFHYDAAAAVLYVHTSDGKPPAAHQIELVRRGNGIFVSGQSYVSVIGFTFRHTGDAGITFGRSSRGDVAAHNTSYGSHQGIWVMGATDALVYANTLFRNDNSGAYFAGEATGARAIGNTAYENAKGLRWASDSNDGLALDNALYENRECGLAIESSRGIVVEDNRLVGNAAQLLVMKGGYHSDRNCFQSGAGQLTADFVYGNERFATLAEYQRAKDQDRASRAGRCGQLPAKVDVRRLVPRPGR